MYNLRRAASLVGMTVALVVSSARGQGGYAGTTYDPASPDRRGQAGFTFLAIGGSARAEAMGGAFNAVQGDPSSVFYDVAGMASIPTGVNGYFCRTNWLSDMVIDHVMLGYKLSTVAVGLTFVSMDYGKITGTIIDLTAPNGYVLTGTVKPGAWAIGTFLALPVTDRFSFGLHVKYAVQDFGAQPYWVFLPGGTAGNYTYTAAGLRVSSFAFDVGTQYNIGVRDIMITMALQNYARPKAFLDPDPPYRNGTFELPLTYRVGVAADVIELVSGLPNPQHQLCLIVDAIDARDALLDAAVGVEYKANLSAAKDGLGVALRVGRRAGNQVGSLGFGGGISLPVAGVKLALDYSYGDYGDGFSAQQWGFSVRLP